MTEQLATIGPHSAVMQPVRQRRDSDDNHGVSIASMPTFQIAAPEVCTNPLIELLERVADAGAWIFEPDEMVLTLTVQLRKLLEVDSRADAESLFKDPLDFFAAESRGPVQVAIDECRSSGQPFDIEANVVTARGNHLWVRALGKGELDETGKVRRMHGVLQDACERKRSEQEASRITMRLSTTLDSISEAFVTLDREGRFTYCNRESAQLLDGRNGELLGQRIWDRLDKVNSCLHREIRVALASGNSVEFEEFYPALKKWLEVRAYPFEEGIAVYFRDITERKAAKDEIEHLAYYDALTQLPNRKLLMDRLEGALARHGSRVQAGALMFIDLDHFKVLNDTLGHAKGDLLLQKVAERLTACVRNGDTVARLGGDEFVIMLEYRQGEIARTARERSRIVGEKVLATLSEPYDLAGYQHHATCSIGITLFSAYNDSIGDLLKQADLAMYEAKAAGRNAVCFFNPRMQQAATANAALNVELRQGLRNEEFLLHYQPQVDRHGRMSGVEALVRWRHPERGIIFPQDFIAQAEESGLILPLGKWVLEEACAQLAKWSLRPDTENLTIAVNVSVRQFRHPEFVDLVMHAINHAGITASKLKLELTESLLANHIDVTIDKMGTLKDAGVTLSLDDFGMGFSALSYLKHLPLDQLKIDRTFVKDVLTDPNDAAIARTIIGLAQSLGLDILAEGVETEAQRQLLVRFGCERYQGYLFCKALPIEELDVFMCQLFKGVKSGVMA